MSNVFRYRSNGKWYTFDKSLLDPQDTAIFDKMSYSDKLKLITIYTQLKPKENDDTIILKTKKEDPKKGIRRAEYLKKKQAIEEAITAATNETDEKKANTMLNKAQEDLKKLNIEYADIVGITSANEVNIAKAQKVVLQDIKELITNVNEGVNTLKADLSKETITELKDNITDLVKAKDNDVVEEVIYKMSQQLQDMYNLDYSIQTRSIVDAINKQIDEIKKLLDFDGKNAIVNDFLEWLESVVPGIKNKTYLIKIQTMIEKMEEYDLDTTDLLTTMKYPYATSAIKIAASSLDEAFRFFKLMANYIRTYNTLKQNVDEARFLKLLNQEAYKYKKEATSSTLRVVKQNKRKDYPNAKFTNLTTTKQDEITKGSFDTVYSTFISKWTLGTPNNKDYIVYHEYTDTDEENRKSWVYSTEIDWCDNGKVIVPSMQEIMDNPKTEELNKTGAVETKGQGVLGASWLGIQTKKSARRDNEVLTNHLLGIINELKGRIKQNEEDINRLFEKEVVGVKEDIRSRQVKPNFLTDITKPITLKPTKDDRRLKKEPDEVDDLVKALNKRRVDIEYSDDSDDDYVWGDGIEQLPLKGGVLAELKKDLEHYGLALNVSRNGKSYYLTVFNRKKDVSRSGAGVEEAKMCVDLAKQQGNEMKYTNLKELYEDIY